MYRTDRLAALLRRPWTSSNGPSTSAALATGLEAHQVELLWPRKAVYGLLDATAVTLAVMSTADGWDLTVPEDDAELLAELRRHGVRPGQRLHIVTTQSEPVIAPEEASGEPRRNRRLSFAGSVQAEPDLSEKTDEYLRGFGRG